VSDYVVIYEQAADGGWGAYLPDLPGVIGLGGSREEAETSIREALAAYVESSQEQDRPLPRPVHEAGILSA
jgi:predicted RNase H-like HicB family nuclease